MVSGPGSAKHPRRKAMSEPTALRNVERVVKAHRQREGAGFMVRRPFPTAGFDFADPFLLLDEMGPVEYGPGEALGAPDHPHRGFETVTYMLEGEFEHEDSVGNKGALASGDVQWMTAGAGVVHSEMPSKKLRQNGGRFHGFQLWVNLPARDKMIAPRYQEIPSSRIPSVESPDGLARARVVAGEAFGKHAVIETRTPIQYIHYTLQPEADVVQTIDPAQHGYVYVFSGAVEVGGKRIEEGELALLGDGTGVRLAVPQGSEVAELLVLSGVPLDEPVAWAGPFVMNTREEILQAMKDYQAGRLGQIVRA
jgi:redox-sensitive bicupin YhaK (pirin superfamily)